MCRCLAVSVRTVQYTCGPVSFSKKNGCSTYARVFCPGTQRFPVSKLKSTKLRLTRILARRQSSCGGQQIICWGIGKPTEQTTSHGEWLRLSESATGLASGEATVTLTASRRIFLRSQTVLQAENFPTWKRASSYLVCVNGHRRTGNWSGLHISIEGRTLHGPTQRENLDGVVTKYQQPRVFIY